jgi:hypothetical protein
MPIHVVTELSIEPHGTSRTLQRLADSSHVSQLPLYVQLCVRIIWFHSSLLAPARVHTLLDSLEQVCDVAKQMRGEVENWL